uniref:Uncharacterized protein n=1 Tax=Arundo donax TaxID=35708 RepID=A0A0A9EZD1_ARUDO
MENQNQKQLTPIKHRLVNMECAANWRILSRSTMIVSSQQAPSCICPQLPTHCQKVHNLDRRRIFPSPPYMVLVNENETERRTTQSTLH